MRNTFRGKLRRQTLAAAAAALALLGVPLGASTANAGTVDDYSWVGSLSICLESDGGSGNGGTLTVAVADWARLNADYYEPGVQWRVMLHEYNPTTRQMDFVPASGWRTYTPRPDGAGTDGSIYYNPGGPVVVGIGGTTVPGQWPSPEVLHVRAGWWVRPYVQAYSPSHGYMTHRVPVDAYGVQTDAVYGCYYS